MLGKYILLQLFSINKYLSDPAGCCINCRTEEWNMICNSYKRYAVLVSLFMEAAYNLCCSFHKLYIFFYFPFLTSFSPTIWLDLNADYRVISVETGKFKIFFWY